MRRSMPMNYFLKNCCQPIYDVTWCLRCYIKWLIWKLIFRCADCALFTTFEVGYFSELGVALIWVSTGRGWLYWGSSAFIQFHYQVWAATFSYGEIPKQMPIYLLKGQVALNTTVRKWMDKHGIESALKGVASVTGWTVYLSGKQCCLDALCAKQTFSRTSVTWVCLIFESCEWNDCIKGESVWLLVLERTW